MRSIRNYSRKCARRVCTRSISAWNPAPRGLGTLNKGLSVEQSLRAVSLLKELELLVGYGFMMFDPSSTFETVRANVGFLRQITGDGTTAAVFGRMQPYAGTPIEAELAASSRLRGGLTNPDYAFLDPQLDEFFPVVNAATEDWIHGNDRPFMELGGELPEDDAGKFHGTDPCGPSN